MKDWNGYPICLKGTTIELTAKQIALLLWEDMAEHGYRRKEQSKYFYLVQNLECNCSYCGSVDCTECPLCNCTSCGTPFDCWLRAKTRDEHREAAHDLVEQIKRAPDLLDTEVSK